MFEIINHEFKSKERSPIKSARATPIPITDLTVLAYTQKRALELKKNAYLQTIHENELTHEPLTGLDSYGIKSLSFEWKNQHQIDTRKLSNNCLAKEVYVRRSVAAQLAVINLQLRSCGLHLYVRSGYRHPKVQEMRFFYAKEKFGKKYATSRFALKEDLVGTDSVFPHSTGGAIDIEIWKGQERLEMGERGVPTGIFDLEFLFSKNPRHSNIQNMVSEKKLPKKILKGGTPDHWKEYRNNRRLLYHTMRGGGFYFILGEFWHWGLGDHLSGVAAKLLNENYYRPWYGEAQPLNQ